MTEQRLSGSRRILVALVAGVSALGWAWFVLQILPEVAGMLKSFEGMAMFFGLALIAGIGLAYGLLGRIRFGSDWRTEASAETTASSPPFDPLEQDLDTKTGGAMPVAPADDDLY